MPIPVRARSTGARAAAVTHAPPLYPRSGSCVAGGGAPVQLTRNADREVPATVTDFGATRRVLLRRGDGERRRLVAFLYEPGAAR